MKNNKNRHPVLLAILLLMVFFSFVIFNRKVRGSAQLERKQQLINMEIIGAIDSVYYMHGKIFVINCSDSLFIEYRMSSEFKNYVEVGDSLNKAHGDSMIRVSKPDRKESRKIKFLMENW